MIEIKVTPNGGTVNYDADSLKQFESELAFGVGSALAAIRKEVPEDAFKALMDVFYTHMTVIKEHPDEALADLDKSSKPIV